MKYEVWAIGYDEQNNITDFDLFLKDFKKPGEAMVFAYSIGSEEYFIDNNIQIPENVYTVEIITEAVDIGGNVQEDKTQVVNSFIIYHSPLRKSIREEDTQSDDCPLGGDIENDCADCIYSCEYHYCNGECVLREV